MMARRSLLPAVMLLAAACGNDAPLSVGDELLPTQPVTTWEVVLQGDDYIALDSAFAIYDKPSGASYQVVAEDFEATLDAHVLTRFTILRTITVRDTAVANGTVLDTLPRYFAGRLVVRFDTLRTDITGEADFAVYQSAEEWDEATATWTQRVDTGDVQLEWQEPGGTLGDLVTSGSWSRADGDSLVLEIDSTTLQALRDTIAEDRGLIIVAETEGTRARIRDIAMRLEARSSRQRDTVVAVSAVAQGRTFIYTPMLDPRSDDPRVGGIPTWRTLIRLEPQLGDIQVPCPPPLDCTMPLRDANVTSALLELRLAEPPPGFVLEDSLLINVSPVLELPGVPFARSPLASPGPNANRRILPSDFDDVDAARPVLLPITVAIRTLLDDSTANVGVAITPFVNLSTFGIVSFRPQPRLRLVLTISQEVQLQ